MPGRHPTTVVGDEDTRIFTPMIDFNLKAQTGIAFYPEQVPMPAAPAPTLSRIDDLVDP